MRGPLLEHDDGLIAWPNGNAAYREAIYKARTIGSKVYIDDAADLVAVVIQVSFDCRGIMGYKCSWMNAGQLQEQWIDGFRLKSVEE